MDMRRYIGRYGFSRSGACQSPVQRIIGCSIVRMATPGAWTAAINGSTFDSAGITSRTTSVGGGLGIHHSDGADTTMGGTNFSMGSASTARVSAGNRSDGVNATALASTPQARNDSTAWAGSRGRLREAGFDYPLGRVELQRQHRPPTG